MNKKNQQKIIIAICGSYGKTTMKEVLSQVLQEKFQVLASAGNENTPLGISKIINKLTPETEILLLEFGEFMRGDIRDLCRLFPPDIGIITGINEQHTERMGGLSNAVECMFEIAEFAKTLVLNADDSNIVGNWQKFSQKDQKTLFYSANNHDLSSIKSTKIDFDKQNLNWQVALTEESLLDLQKNLKLEAEFEMRDEQGLGNELENWTEKDYENEINNSKNFTEKDLALIKSEVENETWNENENQITQESKIHELKINLLSRYCVGNLIAGVLIGQIVGMEMAEIKRGLQKISPVKHRLEPIWNRQTGVLIIDDSYGGNPDGALAAIDVLANFKNFEN